MAGLALALERAWYRSPGLLWLLLPLEWLFALTTSCRRWLFRRGVFASRYPGCPLVVVGNISVGGTGKTPVVMELARVMSVSGLAVAVISRGYGGSALGVVRVTPDSDPREVGEEPALIARRVPCPVFVGRDRAAAAMQAREEGAEVILSDDGLQHYRLRRDIEIIVLDANQPLGNGHLLPLGPLREGAWRLKTVDFVLEHHGDRSERRLTYTPAHLRSLNSGEIRSPSASELGPRVHALAAIARPERFFETLRGLGFGVTEHALRDHSDLSLVSLEPLRDRPLIMTSKDAAKFDPDAHPDAWSLEMDLRLPEAFVDALICRLRKGEPCAS